MEKRFGLIGHPVSHSMSSIMHNAVFKELNLPYTYELFDVSPENLALFMKNIKNLNGLNVTIPHKINVIKYLDEIDKTAKFIGAVNTIKITNKKIGYNTDGIGCIKALEEENIIIKNKNVLVLGAGGVSRAIVFQTINEKANISLTNRTKERAIELIKDVKNKTDYDINLVDFNSETLKKILPKIDILINATSVGMHPNINETPIPVNLLHKSLTILDLVYNPIKTKLLEAAEKINCKTINGAGMLVHQGAEALKIWLNIEPPIEVMKQAILKKLLQ